MRLSSVLASSDHPNRWMIAVLMACLLMPYQLAGADLLSDPKAPNMHSVKDVTGGQRFLLKQDDLTLTLAYKSNQPTELGLLNTGLIAFKTFNGNFVPNPQYVQFSSGPTDFPVGIQSATGIGRMYNNTNDVVVTMTSESGQFTLWRPTVWDPVTGKQTSVPLQTKFTPYGQIYSQIVMADFNADGVSEALLFYCSVDPGKHIEWGMTVLSAQDLNTVGSIKHGPEFYSFAATGVAVPVTGSIVVGDFDGDGKDEVAALFTDNQTVQFFDVASDTLAITPTATLKLPGALTPGTLAAGRFRDTVNDELVAIGQISGAAPANTIYSIQTTQLVSGKSQFSPAVVQSYTQLGYGRATQVSGVLAEAAPIFNWFQPNSEQLIIGLQYNTTPTGFIWIASFDSAFNFKLAMAQDIEGENGCLLDMQVGNFDNQANGQHSPNLQLALFELEGGPSGCTPPFKDGNLKLKITNLNVPSGLDPANPPPPAPWITDASLTDLTLPSGYADMRLLALSAGDLQGRSLRLGTPEKAVIPLQIQPDIVLGIPPMHIDYIKPTTNVLNTANHPGCDDPDIACVLNLTVLPSLPAPGVGFQTGFTFSSDASTKSERKSTTSWGVSVKTTTEAKVSFNDFLEGGSLDIKNAASYAHDGTVARQYNTYSGKTDGLSATTGFADHVFFTQREMNVYFYPVLGRTGCPATNPSCPDSQKVPLYVQFSVPDQVTHADLDATTLEWYQPVHEPGNILSYPWSRNLLQSGLNDPLKVLTSDPPPCRGTDTSTTNYTANWTGTNSQINSSGSSNSFSDDLSVSYTASVGLPGEGDGASFSFGVDVAANTSLSTLNVNTVSLSASSGIGVTKPVFDSDIAQCCLYNFAGYVFGSSSPDSAFQNIDVSDQDGNPVGIQSQGPMYVGFLADPVPDAAGLSCGGTPTWWKQVYSKPDVGLNHPARWGWDKSRQVASFNPVDRSGKLSPLDQPFYQMKGFFITSSSNPNLGPNLGQAQASDQLTLTARIYNFSLVDTTDTIHVRFYGQYYCSSGAAAEHSCIGADKTTCDVASLCGKSFVIGETQLTTIPGFKSLSTQESVPNWVATSVNFDTTPHGNSYMVFWVVTWTQDAAGNIVNEMPGHGLQSIPSADVSNITDVPVESYSNNVGMYGVNSPFFVAPSTVSATQEKTAKAEGYRAGTDGSGVVDKVTLTGEGQMLLWEKDKITARVDVVGKAVGPMTIAYYDGKPGEGGKLIDIQRIPHVAENGSYYHRIFFEPESCGNHALFAQTFAPGMTPMLSEAHIKNVTLDPVTSVQALLASMEKSNLREQDSEYLRLPLKLALRAFEQGELRPGKAAIRLYIRLLQSDSEISREIRNRLIGQARTIASCMNSTGLFADTEAY